MAEKRNAYKFSDGRPLRTRAHLKNLDIDVKIMAIGNNNE
jgi:hypothetical protein